jgi:hypothetical protein
MTEQLTYTELELANKILRSQLSQAEREKEVLQERIANILDEVLDAVSVAIHTGNRAVRDISGTWHSTHWSRGERTFSK